MVTNRQKLSLQQTETDLMCNPLLDAQFFDPVAQCAQA